MSNIALDMNKVHPLNRFRPPAAASAFKVKKWKPIYDMIVSGHIIGKSNIELAAEYDFSLVHIGNILRSDHAQTLIAEASERLRAQVLNKVESVSEMQSEIQLAALKKVKSFMDNDELFKNSPFAFFDRAVKMAAPVSAAPKETPNINVNVNNQVNQATVVSDLKAESINRLTEALRITSE
jgi:hypothetical protein